MKHHTLMLPVLLTMALGATQTHSEENVAARGVTQSCQVVLQLDQLTHTHTHTSLELLASHQAQ